MTKSNKILCIIGAILIAFVGLFGIVFATQKDSVVKADEVVTNQYFVGSNLIVPCGSYTATSDTATSNFLSNNDDFYFVSFDLGRKLVDGQYLYGDFISFHYNLAYPAINITRNIYIDITRNVYTKVWFHSSVFLPQSPRYHLMEYYCHPDFNFNVYKCQIFCLDYFLDGTFSGTRIAYYDVNDNYLFLSFICSTFANFPDSNNHYSSRTYYFNTALSDNQYYNSGVEYGRGLGADEGFDEGYQKCIDDNKQNWIAQGKQEGIAQANDYTFLGLIGATIDAPISAFTSFFDFDLLGVNLKDFFFAVLTFALVIVIIRFALGR